VFFPSRGEPETPRTLTFDISIRTGMGAQDKALPKGSAAVNGSCVI